MCATLSRNACQNRGPKCPCGLLSKPCSLGDEPPSPLSVRDGSAGTTACESLVLLLAMGTIVTRQCGAIEVMYPAMNDRICGRVIRRNCSLRQGRPGFRFARLCHAQLHPDSAAIGPNSRRARQLDTGDQFIDMASEAQSQGQFALEPR